MPTSNKHSVSGQELDNLLKQAFLNVDLTNPKNDAMMETIANTTLTGPAAPAGTGAGNSFFSFKTLIISISLILSVAIVVFLMVSREPRPESPMPPVGVGCNAFTFETGDTTDTADQVSSGRGADKFHVAKSALPVSDQEPVPPALSTEPALAVESLPPYQLAESPVKPEDSVYVFPVLTEAEIKANHKQKKQMIEQLMKLHKDKYAYVPMGSFLYGKDTFSCRAFYMQTTEVSNLEYRTFLFDLLIAGKKQEFLKAKPDQEQWNRKFGKDGYFDPMKQMYFSHPAYNDYPVVNISREGAEMYCVWLSIALNERLKEKGKPLMNDLRLPAEYEWAYAASNKLMYAKYANGTPNLRNSKGLYIQNYNCDTYANSRCDSLHDVYLFHKTEEGKGPVTDGGFFTTVKKAYAPNAYGIYDLAGNVSEMVYLWDGRANKARGFGTKGGSWCSPDYFLEIDARQEFRHPEKPSPLVGFRPVMTALIVDKTKP